MRSFLSIGWSLAALAWVLLAWFNSAGAAPPGDKPASEKAPPSKEPPSPAPKVSWLRADYGPVTAFAMEVDEQKLADTIDRSKTKNYVFRGRLIPLNADRSATICFDTEHLRWAGAWTGGFVEFGGADKNMGPSVAGKIQFRTKPGPGWSHASEWSDPRKVPEGPIPAEWGRYRGLYHHGRKVVLAYEIDGSAVLELPGSASADGATAFTRTLHLAPNSRPQGILLCDEAEATGYVGPLEAEKGDATGAAIQIARLIRGDRRIVAAAIGAPEGAKWQISGGRIQFLLPAHEAPTTLRLVIANLAVGEEKKIGALSAGPVEDVVALTKAGPARWLQTVFARGDIGKSETAYTLDTITSPDENPYGAWMRWSGFDFLPDGRLAACTWDGDVWIADGVDSRLEKISWRRFATGLQQPLGLKVVGSTIYTAGRDQITRLVDLNNDGEADFYENFNNQAGLTLQRHEFVMDLHTDAAGNFYFCRSGHYIGSLRGENCCVMKLPPDGSKLGIVARGLREPNGMSVSPSGEMTVGDNEGNGIPQTPIYHLRPGGNYGYRFPEEIKPKPGEPQAASLANWPSPMIWMPKQLDMSAGGQAWVTGDQFGPLAGHLLHTSYGNCALFDLLLDRGSGDDAWQAIAVKFPLTFHTGIMRARMNPKDGQLYVCGLRGWGTNGVRDGMIYRVRYTGKPHRSPVAWRVVSDGIELTFGVPLDKTSADDDQNWGGNWQDIIGAPSHLNGKKKPTPKTEIPIDSCELLADGRTVKFVIPGIAPVTNFDLKYDIVAADGTKLKGEVNGTINRVPK